MSYEVFPSEEKIRHFKTALTNEEWLLLNHVKELFNSSEYQNRSFEIHVQPNLFFGKMNFIVIEPEYSIWIIGVNNYNPNVSRMTIQDNKDIWILNDGTLLPSPIDQVKDYKSNILNYAGPEIVEAKNNNNRFALMIRTALFLPMYSQHNISNKVNHTTIFTGESLSNKKNTSVWSNFFRQINILDYRLSGERYREAHSMIVPDENRKYYPIPEYNEEVYKKYNKLSKSRIKQQKIRGIAGTGKTSLLAKRVVDCSNRLSDSRGEILVTYFNITMGNYLRDKIIAEGNGKTLNELGIQIINFHSLYKWGKGYSFHGKKIQKQYGAVFVDEGQDFKKNWFNRLIVDYLEEKTNEFVVFADENQNIYDRSTEQGENEFQEIKALPAVPIKGRWNELNTIFRTKNDKIYSLLHSFLVEILKDKKGLSRLEKKDWPSSDNSDDNSIWYFDSGDEELLYKATLAIINYILYLVNEKNISINDITILGENKNDLKKLDFYLKKIGENKNDLRKLGEIFGETLTTFKPIKNLEEIERQYDPDLERKEDRPYKFRFYQNTGSVKISTIHSFKGWETPYVILLVKPSSNNREHNKIVKDYLVYTGLSRAQKGMLIINLDPLYSDFFSSLEIDMVFA